MREHKQRAGAPILIPILILILMLVACMLTLGASSVYAQNAQVTGQIRDETGGRHPGRDIAGPTSVAPITRSRTLSRCSFASHRNTSAVLS